MGEDTNFSFLLATSMDPERRAFRLLHSAKSKTPCLCIGANWTIVFCSHSASSLSLPPANIKDLCSFLRKITKQKYTREEMGSLSLTEHYGYGTW